MNNSNAWEMLDTNIPFHFQSTHRLNTIDMMLSIVWNFFFGLSPFPEMLVFSVAFLCTVQCAAAVYAVVVIEQFLSFIWQWFSGIHVSVILKCWNQKTAFDIDNIHAHTARFEVERASPNTKIHVFVRGVHWNCVVLPKTRTSNQNQKRCNCSV